jgi:hypothetical protein
LPPDLTEQFAEDLLASLQGAVLAQDPAGDLGVSGGPRRSGGTPGEEVDVVTAHGCGRPVAVRGTAIRHGAWFSVTARMDKKVIAAIAAIDETA